MPRAVLRYARLAWRSQTPPVRPPPHPWTHLVLVLFGAVSSSSPPCGLRPHCRDERRGRTRGASTGKLALSPPHLSDAWVDVLAGVGRRPATLARSGARSAAAPAHASCDATWGRGVVAPGIIKFTNKGVDKSRSSELLRTPPPMKNLLHIELEGVSFQGVKT